MCLEFGLRPVSLGEFERSPDLLAVIEVRGAYFYGGAKEKNGNREGRGWEEGWEEQR